MPNPAADTAEASAVFESQRRLLQGLAYRMLGSWAEAEDVVQDAWLRWREIQGRPVHSPRAYLSQTVTRLCLDLLKSARARREAYVGIWLPEPLLDAQAYVEADAGDLAQDLSLALMLALERLSALERAAFLLHDVFDLPFPEIAETLERSEASCRQLASRARARVREARPRYAVSELEGMRLAQAFLRASCDGDMDALRGLLAEDAVLQADGGGKKLAVGRAIVGADKIARFFAGIAAKRAGQLLGASVTHLNGMPGIVAVESDGLPRTTSLEIRDGKISAIYIVRNPDKLRHLVSSSSAQG